MPGRLDLETMPTLLVSGSAPADPVDLARVGRAHDGEQDAVARGRVGRQVGGQEVGALGGAAAHHHAGDRGLHGRPGLRRMLLGSAVTVIPALIPGIQRPQPPPLRSARRLRSRKASACKARVRLSGILPSNGDRLPATAAGRTPALRSRSRFGRGRKWRGLRLTLNSLPLQLRRALDVAQALLLELGAHAVDVDAELAAGQLHRGSWPPCPRARATSPSRRAPRRGRR